MATVKRNDDNTLTVVFNNGYTVKFKQPTDVVLGAALANARRDPNGAADVLIEQCLLDGDKAKLKNGVAYLKQISEVSDDIFGKVPCSFSWHSNEATFEYLDGKMMILKPASRATYSEAQVKARQNPINYVKHILAGCWVDGGDEEIRKSVGHLLGFSELVDTFLEYTSDELGNS
jgi:hypothetical protein